MTASGTDKVLPLREPSVTLALPRGSSIIAQVKKANVQYVLSVPDQHTSVGLLHPIAADPDLKLVRVCKEDECFGIAAGLTYGNLRSLILVQYTGFLYAVNAVRGVAVEQKLPMCFMVGMLGKEPGVPAMEAKKFGLRLVEPILDAMGIQHTTIETEDDVPKISGLIEAAWRDSRPQAILLGGRPEAK
ncbi:MULTISPECIES: decarboxylase [unclassified Beijerinckia]|uniref:decarboxylase n=1 Tax=unclassified Beijerinckia TaxID=2638183 RepID=UPI00089CF237|nr:MULTISPECIES: decarboxylase [unclassified Beijerinckia]MDH7799715.1 sulfopyruvate decarboxylase subunit alpha [Beijerinckia sp. GAS462]SED34596.1 Sulfopyruvate decarboxylase, TPP-binding subunit (coenzyme M biosynthesis) [Beijerinckia sp. 28-YEA-48]